MDNEMQQEVLNRLDAMAAKMGVAAGEMWAILVRQALIMGYMNLAVFVAALLIAVRLKRYVTKNAREAGGFDMDATNMGPPTVGIVVACIITLVAAIISVSRLANPAYYALREIMETVK